MKENVTVLLINLVLARLLAVHDTHKNSKAVIVKMVLTVKPRQKKLQLSRPVPRGKDKNEKLPKVSRSAEKLIRALLVSPSDSSADMLLHHLEHVSKDKEALAIATRLVAAWKDGESACFSCKLESAQMRKALEHSIRGLLIVNKDNVITFANTYWALTHGYQNPSDILGLKYTIFLKKGDIKSIANAKRTAKKKGVFTEEITHLTKEQHEKTFWTRWTPVATQDAPSDSYVISSEDVSALKENEGKLVEQTEELKKVNELMVGRELKMVELKEQVEELKKQLEKAKNS